MASLRVFVSSTCFDLAVLRGQIRSFIEDLGYEPVMSEYQDVVYDPKTHTHTSCIDEVATCDMVVVVIGSRFGGKAVPQAIGRIDLETLMSASKGNEILKKKEDLSITQLEVLRAISSSIPIFAFVDDRVLADHATYEKNKGKSIIDEIEFSSIEKPETAHFIFEFINFLRHRQLNNGICPYSRYQDIEQALRRQWSGLFQKLLNENRTKAESARRIDALTEQFEDLKAAILTAVGSNNERVVARGVVRFRRLIDFVRALSLPDISYLTTETHSWSEFLTHVGVTAIRDAEPDRARPIGMRPTQYLVRDSSSFIELRGPFRVSELMEDWDAFMRLAPDVRGVISDALSEMGSLRMATHYVRTVQGNIDEFLAARESQFQRAKEQSLDGDEA